MRRFIFGWAVTAIAALSPTWASAGDQETAQKIADGLRKSGRLADYSVGVKYRDGTAWLLGRVTSEQQAQTAVKLAEQMPEVSRVINNLDIDRESAVASEASQPTSRSARGSSSRGVASQKRTDKFEVTTASGEVTYPEDLPEVESEPEAEPVVPTQQGPTVPSVRRASNAKLVARRRSPLPVTAPQQVPAGRQVIPMNAQQPMPVIPMQAQQPLPPAPLPQQLPPQYGAPFQPAPGMLPPPAAFHGPARSGQQAQAPANRRYRRPPLGQAVNPMLAAHQSPQYAGQGGPSPQMARQLPPGQMAPIGPIPAAQGVPGAPIPSYVPGMARGVAPAQYDQPHMPNYAWPSYASYPNYAGLTYPKQYSPTAWPYIGPFYPYPQVPLGWRRVTLEWDDGWWFLDFDDKRCH